MPNEVEATTPKPPIAMGDRGLTLSSLDDAARFAKWVLESGYAPNGMDSQAKILVALQFGAELGLSAMRSLAAIHVVEGRPTLDYKAALALIRESGVCDYGPMVGNEGEGDARLGYVEFKRRDLSERVKVTFSVAQAKVAKLWGKTTRTGAPSPWVLYPDDMMIARATSRAVARYFSDVTMGLRVAEEVRDVAEQERTPRDVTPPAAPDPLLALAGTVDWNKVVADPRIAELDRTIFDEMETGEERDHRLAAADVPDDIDAKLDEAAARLRGGA